MTWECWVRAMYQWACCHVGDTRRFRRDRRKHGGLSVDFSATMVRAGHSRIPDRLVGLPSAWHVAIASSGTAPQPVPSATAECQILEDLVLTPVVTERAVRVERQLLLRQGPLLRDRLCCPRTTSASPRPPHRHKPRAATPSTMAWFSTESGQANISIKPSLWPSVLGAVRPTRAPSGSR